MSCIVHIQVCTPGIPYSDILGMHQNNSSKASAVTTCLYCPPLSDSKECPKRCKGIVCVTILKAHAFGMGLPEGRIGETNPGT